MANLKLEANYRSDMSKSRMKKIRRQGYVTASVFGRGYEPVPLEVKLKDIVDQVKRSEHGLMSIFDLEVHGALNNCDGTVIIKDFFKDPLTRKVLDVQFQRVSMTEKVHVSVPIELVGEAVGATYGGIVEQAMDALEIRSLPADIPPKIEVDVSGLEVGQHIKVAEVVLPPGIEVLSDPEMIVCTCVPPHVRREQEAAPEAEETVPSEAAPAGEPAGEE
ncbi:MAG: 50S ribosomal protein L25 [Armatimonadetes bacterium]|nr:50S ribosomal protein L25 [Armatimonadota bacterium]